MEAISDLIPTTEYDTKRALKIWAREEKRLKTQYVGQELDNHLTLMRYVILKKLKEENTRRAERIKELDRQGIDTAIPIRRLYMNYDKIKSKEEKKKKPRV